jgi:hypothetical protein
LKRRARRQLAARPLRLATVVYALATAAAGAAAGGGLRDVEDAWLIEPGATAALLAEPADARAHRWRASAGHGTLFGMAELPQAALEVERRWAAVRALAGWQRLGRDLYRETTWRLALLAGRSWQLGAEVERAALDLGGEPAHRHTALTARLSAPLSGALRVEAWLPLTAPPVWYGRQGPRRWWRLVGGGDGWLWTAAADRSRDGSPSLQGEVLLRLVPRAALGVRCEPSTGTIGLCTAWRTSGAVLRTSHAVHPDLGPSHRFGLVVGGGR